MRVFKFIEPHITGGHAEIVISDRQIIEYMKKIPKYVDYSPEDMIDEFIAIHWAWEIFDHDNN